MSPAPVSPSANPPNPARPASPARPSGPANPVAPVAPTAPAYRRLSVEARRSQLLEAALGLFAHRAPEEVSLDDVAEAAGVSRPLVYRYFPGGKQQLYEAALRSAADVLEQCFDEPPTGPLTERLGRALDRYLAFVDSHDTGFAALLQGGSVVSTSRTTAIVDEVRRAAAASILGHMPVGTPGPRLHLLVRTWISAVEAASLIWLDEDKQPPAGELRDWLLDQFVALLTATAASDEQTATVLRSALAMERADGPVGRLARKVLPVVSEAGHLL
ncbi:TetR family transcriptional regulator [Streptomyces sp. TRM66268-LWL]|uniref:TetR family transcriptional regulator n=1 Tax=Streptomyces polyasparticus TaxID=2767826 RepID=A0ABR7S741_9ACTN|nr:TetR family transcriptional regulator [Streptomyces polyasparticus]